MLTKMNLLLIETTRRGQRKLNFKCVPLTLTLKSPHCSLFPPDILIYVVDVSVA